jgi:putative flippase GtrA
VTSLGFFKFLFVGGFGAVCYFIGASALTFFGFEAYIASFLTYMCLIPFIYSMQKRFVFKSNETHLKSFPRYFVIQLVGIGISVSIPLMLGKIGSSPMISFVAVILLSSFLSYILQLHWAFKKNTT